MPQNLLHKFKPGVPKWVLIFLGAFLWGFASYRILKTGIDFIEKRAFNHWLNYLIGIIGFVPFFLFVFRKVSIKYLRRIKKLDQKYPCAFSFFDLQGYLIMTGMISMGIIISGWEMIPELYKGTFFISLGLSLLASAVFYIYEGILFLSKKKKMR